MNTLVFGMTWAVLSLEKNEENTRAMEVWVALVSFATSECLYVKVYIVDYRSRICLAGLDLSC